jgi:integrase
VASAFITTRTTAAGSKRYVVRYRVGGYAFPIVHAGSFKTMKEAKVRRDLVAGEIAAGRNPADALAAMAAPPRPVIVVRTWTSKFLESRLDIDINTRKNYKAILNKIAARWGDLAPEAVGGDDVAEWVAQLASTLKPGTVQLHLVVLRLLFDYIDVADNPGRDPRVRLPKRVREEPQPPTADQFMAILEALPARWRLLFVVIEQGALRLGEAVGLRWGDFDAANLRLRLPRSRTKRDKARWVYLPDWLIDAIEMTCPLEDRTPERLVFQGITEATAYQAMTRACRNATTAHHHPHDLRHRRITIWHQSGVPARELAERAGHARPSMSLDVYSHVLPADEAPTEAVLAFLDKA